MPLPSKPLKAVFPIVSVTDKVPRLSYSFQGTGFFINSDGTFLTAKHVLGNINTAERGKYSAVMLDLSANEAIPKKISDLKFSEQFDIALGHVEGVGEIQPLNLAKENAPMNRDVLTVEFSGTHSEQIADEIRALIFTPYFRKGHVICYYKSTFPENIPTTCIDLSFPALKGASGAPVIVEADGCVIGMVVGNVERELLPAQLEKVTEDGKYTEEIRYFLPTGKAISWAHLAEFVKSVRSVDSLDQK